jgi:hypothetical protein
MHRSSIVNLFQTSPTKDDENSANEDAVDQANGREDEPAANEEDHEVVVVSLAPKFSEQLHIFSAAQDMRNEAAFCDVSFVVKGNLFRAHKIIVRQAVGVIVCHLLIASFSAWSRWLRALLIEGDDEVVTLDIFSPEAFGAVLDYMYGKQLLFSITVSLQLCVLSGFLSLFVAFPPASP